MVQYTTRLNLYKPGGGSSGTNTPDESVDIDKLNANFDLIDADSLAQFNRSKNFPLAVADATARDAWFTAPVQGDRVWNRALGYEQTYWGAYNSASNPTSPVTTAGWYRTLPSVRIKGNLTGTLPSGVAVPDANYQATKDAVDATYTAANGDWTLNRGGLFAFAIAVKQSGTATTGLALQVSRQGGAYANEFQTPNLTGTAFQGIGLSGYVQLLPGDKVRLFSFAGIAIQSDLPAQNSYLSLIQVQ